MSCNHQKTRAAFCVGTGKRSGSVHGTASKRAERAKSRSEYSRLSGYDTGLCSPAAWNVTPSSSACQRSGRPWRAASASIHSDAMYEYGEEKSNQKSMPRPARLSMRLG